MNTLLEVERLALALPEEQRAVLVNHLLDSPPAEMDDDDDEGIVKALRRDAELDVDPSIGISLGEFHEAIRAGRGEGSSPEEVFARLDAQAGSPRGDGSGMPRRFMRLAGSVQGALDLSARRGFRAHPPLD